MSNLLNQFYKEYNFLYKNGDRVAGFREAVEWFDTHSSRISIQKHITALVKERGDFISSDREAAAFAFACEKLGIS